MKKITHCRACGSKALSPAFTLANADARVAGFPTRRAADVDFVYCDPMRDARACGLLQSARVTEGAVACDPSARHATTRNHLRQIATEALELISERDCAALDIGCNDGTLLSFYPRWVDRFGVDPADTVDEVGPWAWTAKAALPSAELDRAFGAKTFDIITAVSVLETVDEPRAFLARIKSLLAPDGVVALETLYAPMALTRTAIEAFASGASAVYSLGALERLVRDAGLKIFRGALTEKDGGSIRLFLTHAGLEAHDFDPWYERLARLWDEENALALRAAAPYQAFERRADEVRRAFRAALADLRENGGIAHLLGDGPQSGALVALAGPERSLIKSVVVDGAAGDGRAFGLPLISQTESRAAEPDCLLAPASLKREMLERWRESILLGARMILATPAPHLVTNKTYAAELARTLASGDGAGGVETLRAILGAAGGPRLVERPAAKSA